MYRNVSRAMTAPQWEQKLQFLSPIFSWQIKDRHRNNKPLHTQRGYPSNLVDKLLSEVTFSDSKSALKEQTKVRKEIVPFVHVTQHTLFL